MDEISIFPSLNANSTLKGLFTRLCFALPARKENVRGDFRVSLPGTRLDAKRSLARKVRVRSCRAIMCALCFFFSSLSLSLFSFYDSNARQVHTRVILAGKIGSSAQLTLTAPLRAVRGRLGAADRYVDVSRLSNVYLVGT